ncbi:P-loop containing nucleoside triphosphate hydrolase protein [Cytidiella melzeri]|nr:P-loop containing nucleoside triphosphate hydrolase protein [Cytidiella melzeri]
MECELRQRANGMTPRWYQRDCAEAAFLGVDTGLICSTGSGKTEAFMLILLADPECKSKLLIISTLNALEVDQAERFARRGITAAAVNGETYSDELHQRLMNNEVRAIITSPEMMFQHPRFSELVRSSSWMKNVAATVIDEAHCVIEWGKEFRRDFGQVEKTRSLMTRKPIFFCTATLTPAMLDELLTKLSFSRERMFILNLGNERHNITSVVCRLKNPTDCGALDFVLDEALAGHELVPVLIYVNTRELAMRIWLYLLSLLPRDSTYREQIEFVISTRDTVVKELVIKLFMLGLMKIIVSTESAGMGLDVPHLPRVIQFQSTRTLVEWAQHGGRGERNGKPAYALMLVEPSRSGGVNEEENSDDDNDSEDVQYRKKMEPAMREYITTPLCRSLVTKSHFNNPVPPL